MIHRRTWSTPDEHEKYINKYIIGKPKGKRLLGRSRHRWKYRIKADLQETDVQMLYGFMWFGLQSSIRLLVISVPNIRVPGKPRNFLTNYVFVLIKLLKIPYLLF